MASQAVKEKLQRSILRRRSIEQAKTQRETVQISELDVQHEHPNTPPSPQHRDLFPSSSNSLTYQSSPPSNQSDHSAQVWYYSVQQFQQMDRNPWMKMWVPVPFNVSQENIFNHFIVWKDVYLDTALYTNHQLPSPQLDSLPDVCFSLRHHRPLHSCQSQPLISSKLPSGIFHRYSLRVPERPHSAQRVTPATLCSSWFEQRPPEAEELSEEHTGHEWSSSHHKWQRRPAFRNPHSLHQSLRHVHSSPSTFILPDTADHALDHTPDHAPDHTRQTGLVYDPQMLAQQCICGNVRCEVKHAGRIPGVFHTLQERGVSNQCKWLEVMKEECRMEVIELLHQNRLSDPQLIALREAAGGVIYLMKLITQGQLRNGFAIVQTLGHDVSQSSRCTSVAKFSSVAIAAKQLQQNHYKRNILILDWDVHHCNTTQEMFYTDPNILHISLHRHSNAPPAAPRGHPEDVGSGDGKGFSVNVEWSCDPEPHIGDVEYLAAFRTVIKPMAVNFRPEFILISTQFNSVQGHPENLTGTRVSAQCFGLLTQNLMELCGGRVVVVLERGHDVTPVCEASTACVSALLKKQVEALPQNVLMKKPCDAAVQSLHRVLQIHSKYWPSVRDLLHTVGESWLGAEGKHSAHTDTTSALALLSVNTPNYSRFCRGGNEPVEHDEDETV